MPDCLICLESFDQNNIAALSCGHVYHIDCIGAWVATKSSCPACSHDINKTDLPVIKLYLDIHSMSLSSLTSEERDMAELKRQNEQLQKELRRIDKTYMKKCEQVDQLEEDNKKCKRIIQTYKAIKDVQDTGRRMESLPRVEQLRQWAKLPRQELVATTGALLDNAHQLQRVIDDRDRTINGLSERVRLLKRRAKMLEEERQRRPATNNESRAAPVLELPIRPKRKRVTMTGDILSTRKQGKQPAIDIHSGDDTADEDDTFWISPATTHNNNTTTPTPSTSLQDPNDDDEYPPPVKLNVVSPVRR
ncbi:hypothetical protein [Absidia glauca]|uniref:RING-type domain-containing protein n=1 Tax=Absidia glauca TaxID=4829 RepID=A0A163JF58_ABSGL|nr:hypothetical protein [Absidia glauca]